MRAALVVAVVLASSPATADVTWTAPAGCPTAATVRDKIERRLGELSLADVGAIEVTVTRANRQYTATIDTRAISVASTGRTLTAARCDELADAVALIVARLATEEHERVLATPVVEVPALVPIAKREAPVSTLASTKEQPPATTVWTGGFRALALSGIGMTPEVGVGADLSMFVQRDTAFAEIGYARWAPRPMQVLASTDGAVDFDIQLVALRGGWASTRMPLRGWAGIEIGQMHGSGPALRSPESGVGRWIAIASGFGVGWPISPRTRLVGTFEVAVPVERAKFQFMDGSEIREPAPISARSALGLELAWR